jgi:hypothetical protein
VYDVPPTEYVISVVTVAVWNDFDDTSGGLGMVEVQDQEMRCIDNESYCHRPIEG